MNDRIEYANQVLIQLTESVGRALPGVFAGLAIVIAFLVISSVFRRFLRHLAGRVDDDRRPLVALASETVRYGLLVVGLITGLGTMGIDVSALIAGLGLTGFALGFALRDAVANLLAGVLIILYRPFRPGDTIAVAGYAGRVVSIDFRYTVLEAGDKTVLVPNGITFGKIVEVG